MTLAMLPADLTPDQILALVRAGDQLLYRPQRFDLKHPGWIFGALIRFKTWHNVSHCELYIGKGKSAASRDGVGVGLYPLRTSELAYILRPTQSLDWAAFWKWFYTVNGQAYDWVGLVRFAWFKSIPTTHNDKMFCSEFLTRADRALGVNAFNPDEDADAVAPASFLLSPNLVSVSASGALSASQDAA